MSNLPSLGRTPERPYAAVRRRYAAYAVRTPPYAARRSSGRTVRRRGARSRSVVWGHHVEPFARAFVTRLLHPGGRRARRLGLSPDVVTFIGTIGVCFGALVFYPRDEFFVGTLVITRLRLLRHPRRHHGPAVRAVQQLGRLPRLHPGPVRRRAVFGGLVLYFARRHRRRPATWFALACLVVRVRDELRAGPGRGAGRDRGQCRDRRAGRPAGRRARRHRADRAVRLARHRARRSFWACSRSCPPSPSRSGCSRSAAPGPGPERAIRPPGASIAPAPAAEPARALARHVAAYRRGWWVVRRLPDRAAYRAVRRPRRRRRTGAAARAWPGCAPTMRGSARSSTVPRSTPWSGTGCGRTCGTGARRSGCPT